MNIAINNNSDTPIYEQISSQIKALIIKNELKKDDALPSMRFLAKDLRISVITTKRAYEELERDGFIYTVAGKGSFIAQINTENLKEHHSKKVEEHLKNAVIEAKTGSISLETLQKQLEFIYTEGE